MQLLLLNLLELVVFLETEFADLLGVLPLDLVVLALVVVQEQFRIFLQVHLVCFLVLVVIEEFGLHTESALSISQETASLFTLSFSLV